MEPKVLIRRLITGALACCCIAVSSSVFAETVFWSSGERTAEEAAKGIVSGMSDSELIGQVLMLGYLGTEPTDEFLRWVGDWGIGGVKVFGWNAADLGRLANGISLMQKQAVSSGCGIPLFVATDQEGGWVRHVKGETSTSPGNMAIGASGIALDAYESGLIIGRELSVLGINMNFAPTVDVYTHPDAHVIGPRSFSSDPVQTAFLSVAFYHGLEEAGVISTAKHYPGHGNTDADSHGSLPVINDNLDTIWDIDLLPYRMLIKEGLPAIMSGHLNFPLISGSDEPATLCPVLLKDVLRDKMGYTGLIITDDMMMYGVRQSDRSIPKICEMALRAGNDMVMISRPPDVQEQVRSHLLALLIADPGFKSLIAESVERIVRTKLTYLQQLPQQGKVALFPDPERVKSELPDSKGESFFFDLACRSTTMIRKDAVPIDPAVSQQVLLAGYYPEFFAEGKAKYADAGTFDIGPHPISASGLQSLIALAGNFDTVIVCLANDGNLETLKRLKPVEEKIVVLSVLTPVYLRETPWVRTAVAVYGTGLESFKAAFAALAGDFVPEGRLPISLTGG
ncbi:MAG: glycoside hydrolase family 3 protein [Spirochaetales bacterium]|nr:glycoside hydrolase family 3 protein [Spirochaetales bacterium]